MLELCELVKRYGDTTALDGLSLAARRGRLLGFLGPNGAGKTTAMRAVFGLVRLDAGALRWDGRPVTRADVGAFGYMPEERGLYPRLPVAGQLAYLARLSGMGASDARAAAHAWLDRLGLAERSNDPVDQLSHGNQQRAQLAAALVHNPELVVLDEPFSGLDPLGVEAMTQVLRELVRAGAAVVFSSHQLDLVEELCDDVVIVAAGRQRLTGALDDVRGGADYREAEVRLAGGKTVSPPNDATVIGTTAHTTRLRVPVATTPQALLDQLVSQGRVERFGFGPPRLSQRFSEVVGASVAEMETRVERTELEEVAS